MQIEVSTQKKCLLHVSELKTGEVYTNEDYDHPYIATAELVVSLHSGSTIRRTMCTEHGWIHQPQAKVVL